MKAGLYVLARLEGVADAPLDLQPLGFTPGSGDAWRGYRDAACVIGLADAAEGALDLWEGAAEVCGLAGYLDEPEQLAAELGLTSESPARLAAGALARFGAEAAHRMLGEWELVHWQPAARRLTLMSSRARRDSVYFQASGKVVAVSPEPMRLARDEGAAELDPVNFALHCGRHAVRQVLADQTIWKGVLELAPGTRESFSGDRRQSSRAREDDEFAAWTGSFEDAIEHLDALGRRIVRQHLGRHGRMAFQLSGGQDSTLLCCWAARERLEREQILCLCSAAPAGSGLRDETAVSQAAADQLELRLERVTPPREWNVYRPRAEAFRFRQHPVVAESHPVNRALQEAALRFGASAMVGGNFGEMTLTGGQEYRPGRSWMRNRREDLREWMRARRDRPKWPADAFHVRFTPEFLAGLPESWRAVWQEGPPAWTDGVPGRPIGAGEVTRKSSWEEMNVADGLRRILPFRDRRLIAAAAVLPSEYRNHGGMTRALSRALLRGRVPEEVRLRTEKMPFSPDFRGRLERQAPDTVRRVNDFEDAGVGAWIDLVWLRERLGQVAQRQVSAPGELYAVQKTAHAAEFLMWLRGQRA